MPIGTPSLKTSSGSSADAGSYSTASVTSTAFALGLVAVTSRRGASTPSAPSSVTGPWGTMTKLTDVTFNTIATPLQRLSLWYGPGESQTEAVVIDYGVETQTACGWNVIEIVAADVDVTAGNFYGGGLPGSNRADAVSSLSCAWFLGADPDTENGAIVYTCLDVNTAMSAAADGWTEIGEVGTTTPAQRLQAQWIPTIGDAFIDTVPAAVISSGTPDVAMIILELVAHHNFVKKHEQHRRSPHGLWLPPPPLTPAGVVV